MLRLLQNCFALGKDKTLFHERHIYLFTLHYLRKTLLFSETVLSWLSIFDLHMSLNYLPSKTETSRRD